MANVIFVRDPLGDAAPPDATFDTPLRTACYQCPVPTVGEIVHLEVAFRVIRREYRLLEEAMWAVVYLQRETALRKKTDEDLRRAMESRVAQASRDELEVLAVAYDRWKDGRKLLNGQEMFRLLALADELPGLAEKLEAAYSDEAVAHWLRTSAEAIDDEDHKYTLRNAADLLEDDIL